MGQLKGKNSLWQKKERGHVTITKNTTKQTGEGGSSKKIKASGQKKQATIIIIKKNATQ